MTVQELLDKGYWHITAAEIDMEQLDGVPHYCEEIRIAGMKALLEFLEETIKDEEAWDRWECEPSGDDWDEEPNWYQQDMIDLYRYER